MKKYFNNKTHITLLFERANKKKMYTTYTEQERNMPNVWNIMDIKNISSLKKKPISDI